MLDGGADYFFDTAKKMVYNVGFIEDLTAAGYEGNIDYPVVLPSKTADKTRDPALCANRSHFTPLQHLQ
jgi:hypothetical protein